MAKIKLYLAAGAAFMLALFGIYYRGKSAGAQAERDKLSHDNLKAMKTQKEIRDEIMDDIDLASRAQRWVRSDDER